MFASLSISTLKYLPVSLLHLAEFEQFIPDAAEFMSLLLSSSDLVLLEAGHVHVITLPVLISTGS